jgi:vacuolar-type H+-ATPase subunit E/Vma4
MSLETLVEEIRHRGEAELAAVTASRDAEAAQIVAERERRLRELGSEAARLTALAIARERAQRVAAAKLHARKLLYEAREKRLTEAMEETRALLQEFAQSDEYASVLKRMITAAVGALGKPLRISGRGADATLLSRLAGKNFDPTPQPILGGVIAETPDGNRRLNLSFNELLRLREDRVREILA